MMRCLLVSVAILLLAPSRFAAGREQVAVLRFLPRGGTGEERWLGTGLADLLGGVLSAREDLVVVERERVADLLRELELLQKGVLQSADAARVGRVAAADRAILGTWAIADGTLEIEASLVDAATGKVLHVAKVRGGVADLNDLVAALAAEVFGGSRPGPSAKVAGTPVRALAEYYRGIRAEENGDFPRAFLYLSRAARTDPPHPRAALDLGGLYARMGEPLHAAAEWRHFAGDRTDDAAINALHLAARTLETAGEPALAARIWEDLSAREPLREDVSFAVTSAARLRLLAGDGEGALNTLTRGAELLRAEIVRIKEDSRTWRDYPRCRGLVQKLEPLQRPMGEILDYRRRLFTEEYLAGRLSAPPPDLTVLDPDDPVITWERLREQSDAGVPSTFDFGRPAGRFHVLAPLGFAITSARVSVHLAPPPEGRRQPGSITVFPWGQGSREGTKELPLATEPRNEELRFDLPRPAAHVQMGAWGPAGTLESCDAEFDLIPATGDDWPERPAAARKIVSGVEGFAQNAKISRDQRGDFHVVFNDGSFRMLMGRAIGQGQPGGGPSSLFIATSTDGGETFGPARRLPVSSEREDVHPVLLHARDGVHHLVWFSNRSDPAVFRAWYSRSTDLVHWSYPRQVPVPFVPMAQALTGQTLTVGSSPVLVEGRDRRIHLFLDIGWGEQGEGVYRMDTPDGLSWTAPALVAAGEVGFDALSLPDGTLLVASRGRSGPEATIHRSRDGGTWTAKPLVVDGGAPDASTAGPPNLARTDDGRIVLLEGFQLKNLRLSISKDGERFTGKALDLEGCWVQGLVPAGPDRILAVLGIHMAERPGMLFLLPLEAPR